MNPTRIASMRDFAVAFDTETHLVQPGLLAPPLVCASIAGAGVPGRLLSRDDARDLFERSLDDDRVILVGANIAYDMLVMAVDAARRGVDLMPKIFAAYEAGRVFDVQIAEALHAIAEGTLDKDPRTGNPLKDPLTGKQARYSLAVVTDLVLGRVDAKQNDRWRLSYALLEDIPIADWPADARQYPVDDACNTLEVALAQAGHVPRLSPHDWQSTNKGASTVAAAGFACSRCGLALEERGDSKGCPEVRAARNLHDLAAQVYAAWCLHLGAAWGLRTDPIAIDALEAAARVGREAGLPTFIEAGFVRADGSEVTPVVKRAVALAYGADPSRPCPVCNGTAKVPSEKTGKPVNCVHCSATGMDLDGTAVPRTEPTSKFPNGQVQTGRDILIESGDERLMEYGASQEDDKILDTYVPELRLGVDRPVNLKPNSLRETSRVSYSGVWQLLPRNVSARLLLQLKRYAAHVAGGAGLLGVRDCIVPRQPQYEIVEVPDDYVLQPGEERVP